MGGKGSGRKKIVSDKQIANLYHKEKSLRKVGKMASLSYQRISQRLNDTGISPRETCEEKQKERDEQTKNIFFRKPVLTIKEFILNCRKEGIRIGSSKASRILKECGVFISRGKNGFFQENLIGEEKEKAKRKN